MSLHTSIGGVVSEVTQLPVAINGVTTDLTEMWAGIGGVNRQIFGDKYDPVFENNDWPSIIEACQNNEVPETWVADGSCYKDMLIDGKNYRIDIIGKNHDTYAAGGTAPLTFQLHDSYNSRYPMIISGGRNNWETCIMRTKHLPSILTLMPAEVQQGIREVQKLTSAGNLSSSIQTTSEKLFLLSEVEISGSIKTSYSGEGSIYDYYQVGNSKIKKVGASAMWWWTRSPSNTANIRFCVVLADGNLDYGNGPNSGGVSFAFCF